MNNNMNNNMKINKHKLNIIEVEDFIKFYSLINKMTILIYKINNQINNQIIKLII